MRPHTICFYPDTIQHHYIRSCRIYLNVQENRIYTFFQLLNTILPLQGRNVTLQTQCNLTFQPLGCNLTLQHWLQGFIFFPLSKQGLDFSAFKTWIFTFFFFQNRELDFFNLLKQGLYFFLLSKQGLNFFPLLKQGLYFFFFQTGLYIFSFSQTVCASNGKTYRNQCTMKQVKY